MTEFIVQEAQATTCSAEAEAEGVPKLVQLAWLVLFIAVLYELLEPQLGLLASALPGRMAG